MNISRRKRCLSGRKKYSKTRKHYLKKRHSRQKRRITQRSKRGGVPNNIIDDTLIRLPHTRQNIINGYAMSIARNPDHYDFFTHRLEIFLNSRNFEQVSPEELNNAIQSAQERLM